MPQIRVLTEADIESVTNLVHEAGWNQLSSDWFRLVRLEPDGCFVAVDRGRPIATVTTTKYATDLAWIGMMLVHSAYRRRGIGTSLMQRALKHLRGEQVGCMKLDATPEGRFLYEQLGFMSEWDFFRWERPSLQPLQSVSPTSRALRHGDLDTAAFGVDRSALLSQLGEASSVAATDDGFGMIRSGRLAAYLGPVTARTPAAAEHIVRELLNRFTGPVLWDIPGPNPVARKAAESLGFRPLRRLTRMVLGQVRRPPEIQLQFALAAPETG